MMRVRVSYTVDVPDDIRRAINEWYGRPGLASRDEVRSWYEANGHSMDQDLGSTEEEEAGSIADMQARGWAGGKGDP